MLMTCHLLARKRSTHCVTSESLSARREWKPQNTLKCLNYTEIAPNCTAMKFIRIFFFSFWHYELVSVI